MQRNIALRWRGKAILAVGTKFQAAGHRCPCEERPGQTYGSALAVKALVVPAELAFVAGSVVVDNAGTIYSGNQGGKVALL